MYLHQYDNLKEHSQQLQPKPELNNLQDGKTELA